MKKIIFALFIIIYSSALVNAQWELTNGPYSFEVKSLAVLGQNIFAGCRNGVYRSSYGGDNWTPVNNGLPNVPVNCLATNGNDIFAGTEAGLFLSSDYGDSWNTVNNNWSGYNITAIVILDTNIFVAQTNTAGDTFGICLSTNYGGQWSLKNNGLTTYFFNSILIKDTNIFLGGMGMYLSTNNGGLWSPINNGLPANNGIRSVIVNDTNIFAGTTGYGKGIFRSGDNGNNWYSVNGLPLQTNVDAMLAYGNTLFTSTDFWGVFISSDGGYNWYEWNSEGISSEKIQSFAISDSTVYAGTLDGYVWKRSLTDLIGIYEINNNYSFNIYPVPSSNKLNIEFIDYSLQYKTNVGVYDLHGRILMQQDITNEITELNISLLEKGVYIIKVTNNKITEITRFVKS